MSQTKEMSTSDLFKDMTDLELAQVLAQRMAIAHQDWHRLKGNRQAQAQQQLASALVFLLNNQPEEALLRLQQAQGWLDHSISPLPCPGHGNHKHS